MGSIYRKSFSNIYNLTLRLTLNLEYQDYNSTYFAIRKKCIEDINFTHEEIKSYNGLHRYILPLAHKQGFKIKELDIEARERFNGKSTIKVKKDFYPIFKDHIKFLIKYYNFLQS
jgi:hypothetical protein